MIYQLKTIPESHKTLSLTPMTLLNKIGDEKLVMRVHKQPSTNESLKDDWKEINCEMRDMEDSVNPTLPDISLWANIHLFVSDKAHKILREKLESHGDFLPIKADGHQYYIFTCFTYGKEIESSLSYEYHNGNAINLTSLEFDESDAKDKPVFKSNSKLCGSIFCNDDFKSICENNNLQGLRFEEDLLAIF